jgi:cell division protein ZipA
VDFDLREWLLILGPVFIAVVLIHGYFRMRAGQNQIRMKLDKSFLTEPGEEAGMDELNLLKAELPNGGARVIRADDPPVPTLIEPLDDETGDALLISADELTDPAEAVETEEALPVAAEPAELPDIGKAPAARLEEPVQAPVPVEASVPAGEDEAAGDAPVPKPEKFVVLNVLALNEPFAGQRLVEILVESEMTFGEMDIFHRNGEDGNSQFSLASAVEPGTFNMATIEHFSTPGITMFMRVHELSDPLAVLDEMLGVAETIAQELDGEVCDETRSVMTPQTVEHCRQSVREFQFRHSA